MYNLDQHESYNDFKSFNVIEPLINKVMSETNYNFNTFNKLIPVFADDLAGAIVSPAAIVNNKNTYRNTQWTNKDELSAKIKGDIFELFVMFTLQYFRGPDVFIKHGTYTQVNDAFDVGMDFFGISEFNRTSRIFGQIKYRTPNIKMTPDEIPFNRTVCYKLIGAATVNKQFDFNKDVILLVTNINLNDALYFKLKEDIGVAGVNPSADSNHQYIKFIDKSVFQNLIKFNYQSFWLDFLDEFK